MKKEISSQLRAQVEEELLRIDPAELQKLEAHKPYEFYESKGLLSNHADFSNFEVRRTANAMEEALGGASFQTEIGLRPEQL